ncbi:MAG: hypothetical protein ABF246_09905 [Winogradskyella sp.]
MIKKTLLQLPEYILIVAVLFYWSSSNLILNPIAIALLILLIFQIFTKNKVIGLILPTVLILASCYMLLAVISEFNEFPAFNSDAKLLLFVGLSFFLSTIIVASVMLYKYLKPML